DTGAGLERNLAVLQGTDSIWDIDVFRPLIAAAERVTGQRIARRETARRPGDPPVLVADARRAREVLGWVPRLSDLDTIIKTAWAWHGRDPNERQRAAGA
ncbi:MAG TPA: hypothetical protein VEC75_04900, partial [Stellaceae bacterium]|nr:hypothetical protein [Stellaceae bacterium]